MDTREDAITANSMQDAINFYRGLYPNSSKDLTGKQVEREAKKQADNQDFDLSPEEKAVYADTWAKCYRQQANPQEN